MQTFWAELEIKQSGHLFRRATTHFQRLSDLESAITWDVKHKHPEIRAKIYHGQICIVPNKIYKRVLDVNGDQITQ